VTRLSYWKLGLYKPPLTKKIQHTEPLSSDDRYSSNHLKNLKSQSWTDIFGRWYIAKCVFSRLPSKAGYTTKLDDEKLT